MCKKEIIFIGPPACGKGTQSQKLAEALKLPHIDTGSLLRRAAEKETEAGKIIKECMNQGAIVPPEIISKIMKESLENECADGFILDGFPRNMEQAEILTEILKEINSNKSVDFKVLYFNIPEAVLMERIVNRRFCKNCGRIYNLKFLKPVKSGICDKCGGLLVQRDDDKEEKFGLRMNTFYNETLPVINFYKNQNSLIEINATGNSDDVFNSVKKLLEI